MHALAGIAGFRFAFLTLSAPAVRIAGPSDIDAVAAFFAQPEIALWTRPLGVREEEAAAGWDQAVRAGRTLTAWQASKLVGCASLEGGQVCFAVATGYRRCGLASLLLRTALFGWQGRRGLVTALVRRGNAGAEAVLQRQGFRFDGLCRFEARVGVELLARYSIDLSRQSEDLRLVTE